MFPFPDVVEAAAAGGVTAIIQPGGSIRDEDSIKAADEHNMLWFLLVSDILGIKLKTRGLELWLTQF